MRLFLFSFLCFVAVVPAFADIASTTYVDNKVKDGTLTVKSNGMSEEVNWTANSSTSQEVDIDVSKVRSGGKNSTTMADMWLE